MQSKESDNLIIARFFPNEDVYEQLKNVCLKYQIKTGIIISGLGQLKDIELGFFKEKGDYLPQEFEGPCELLSLSGIVSLRAHQYEFHLHSVFGGPDKMAIGGHFISGKVSVTCEVVLRKTDLPIKRVREEETGLNGLFLE